MIRISGLKTSAAGEKWVCGYQNQDCPPASAGSGSLLFTGLNAGLYFLSPDTLFIANDLSSWSIWSSRWEFS